MVAFPPSPQAAASAGLLCTPRTPARSRNARHGGRCCTAHRYHRQRARRSAVGAQAPARGPRVRVQCRGPCLGPPCCSLPVLHAGVSWGTVSGFRIAIQPLSAPRPCLLPSHLLDCCHLTLHCRWLLCPALCTCATAAGKCSSRWVSLSASRARRPASCSSCARSDDGATARAAAAPCRRGRAPQGKRGGEALRPNVEGAGVEWCGMYVPSEAGGASWAGWLSGGPGGEGKDGRVLCGGKHGRA